MYRKFASIQFPDKYGYVYESSPTDYSGHPQFSRNFRMYETYGDGLTQHSPHWPVTRDFLADYLLSLANAMIQDDELLRNLRFEFMRGPNEETIEFCESVEYKEPGKEYRPGCRYKTQYYSVQELKVSTSENKRHDKRYERVEEWNDGYAKAVLRMLMPDYADGFYCYCIATNIDDYIRKNRDESKMWIGVVGEFLEWYDHGVEAQRQLAHDVHESFKLCRDMIRTYELRESTAHRLKYMTENAKPKQAAGAAVDSATEAA